MMNQSEQSKVAGERKETTSHRDKYLEQLQGKLTDPLHKRIIAAYQNKDDPVASMEAELGSILTEIAKHEA